MRNSASVVIVGGGIVGCAIAYNLARRGQRHIVLVEERFPGAGSTGRCAAGVRKQFGTVINCRLSHESIRILENLNAELEDNEHDIEFKQKGYLILAYTQKEYDQFQKNVYLQNELGIPSRLITPEEAKEIVPHLNIRGLLGATFCHEDGHCNPFKTTFAYAQAARRLGVDVETYTRVTGIETHMGKVKAVITDKGRIETGTVVNAAGPYAQHIAAMAGIKAPNYAERHQILVTEPVNQIQGPMVLSFSRRFYCQQTPHGSFMMGLGDPHEPKTNDTGHSWQFLDEVARTICDVLPPMREVRVVRQWSGSYDMTPDSQPILGPVPTVDGFYMAAGFSGHGFMMGPITGVLMAEMLTGVAPSIDISILDFGRFERGDLVIEPSVV